MPTLLTCPHGHQWICRSDTPDDKSAQCPICERAAQAPQPTTAAYPRGPPTVDEMATAHHAVVESEAESRFTILRPHAKGGLGEVSVARDERLHRQVALKTIRRDRLDSPYARERFLNEAEITGQLEHPGIVPIYALEEGPDGQPYY